MRGEGVAVRGLQGIAGRGGFREGVAGGGVAVRWVTGRGYARNS